MSPRTSSTPALELAVVERRHVERPHGAAVGEHAAREMEPEEAGPTGDRDQRHACRVARAQRCSARVTDRVPPAGSAGGGRSLTSTAATSSTSIATMLSPIRLRRSAPGVSPRSSRGAHEEVMHRSPAERDADDRDLDEQGMAVVGRPEIGERRQAGDREIGAGEHEHRHEDGRDPGEAEERAPPQRRRERPDARRQGNEAADPEDRGDEVQPVGELGQERRVRLDALMSRQRQAGGEAEPDQERRPEEPRPVEDPREQDEGRHDRVAQRHRDERDPEARLRRERREVAVEQVDERHLQRVGRPASRTPRCRR